MKLRRRAASLLRRLADLLHDPLDDTLRQMREAYEGPREAPERVPPIRRKTELRAVNNGGG